MVVLKTPFQPSQSIDLPLNPCPSRQLLASSRPKIATTGGNGQRANKRATRYWQQRQLTTRQQATGDWPQTCRNSLNREEPRRLASRWLRLVMMSEGLGELAGVEPSQPQHDLHEAVGKRMAKKSDVFLGFLGPRSWRAGLNTGAQIPIVPANHATNHSR